VSGLRVEVAGFHSAAADMLTRSRSTKVVLRDCVASGWVSLPSRCAGRCGDTSRVLRLTGDSGHRHLTGTRCRGGRDAVAGSRVTVSKQLVERSLPGGHCPAVFEKCPGDFEDQQGQ
jgi:hypothetical protein